MVHENVTSTIELVVRTQGFFPLLLLIIDPSS
jgi:hypothetical protein